MSLFLKKEEMWDMPLYADPDHPEKKHLTHWFANIVYVCFKVLCKLFWRYEVTGVEKLRAFDKVNGVIVISNHTSYLDVVFLWLSARTKQWIRFIARENLFDVGGGLLGQGIGRVGGFPIKRDAADRTALKRASTMLKRKELVGIMPEGTRRGRGTAKLELHSGVAFIARMGKSPIMPSTVRNVEKIKEKGKLPRFPKVYIEYGDPILLSDFDCLPKEKRLDACTWYAMRECFALNQQCPAEEVDMVALFPDCEDFTETFKQLDIPHHTAEELAASMKAAQLPAKAEGDA